MLLAVEGRQGLACGTQARAHWKLGQVRQPSMRCGGEACAGTSSQQAAAERTGVW